MTFGLTPGKLGFKLGDVLVGLKSGTTDTPEAIKTTEGQAHVLQYLWNPDTLSYEIATTGGVGVGQEVTVTNLATQYAVRLDYVDTTTTYIGKAAPGSAEGSAVWRIMRLTTTGDDLATQFADGDLLFNNVWDNRAALSYS